MRTHFASALVAGLAGLLAGSLSAHAANLTGQVKSDAEGAMEGVLVSAQKTGSTITITVVSDKDGHFSFPSARMEPGAYKLSTRAVGYDLDGPKQIELADAGATVDVKLRKARNLAAQLTNTEWMISVPGTDAQKASLLNCVGCHTLERPLMSTHDADEFVGVLERMSGYAQVSTPLMPQRTLGGPPAPFNPEAARKMADWLAKINLSEGMTREYPLKTLPRPTGKATHVVITEYALPRPTLQPHDVILDKDGLAWFTAFGEQKLGRLDPTTGKVAEFELPVLKTDGSPTGLLDLEADHDGNLWSANMFQGAIHKFDRKTEKFQSFPVPKELDNNRIQINMVAADHSAVDGKVWTFNVGSTSLYRVDLATGKYEAFAPYKMLPKDSPYAAGGHAIYGIASDSKNNVYFTDFADRKLSNVGKLDAKTGEVTIYPLLTEFARARRNMMDDQDRYWFAEYRGNRIGMLDTNTGKIQEWDVPTPWTGPYHIDRDKNGMVWTAGMTSDRVVRLDPSSGQTVEYLLPRETNVRRVYVDNTTTPPSFWVGSNHGASIVKLEPLD